MSQPALASIPTCGKGTLNGEVAQASRFGFAGCVLSPDHRELCDSGPLLDTARPADRAAVCRSRSTSSPS